MGRVVFNILDSDSDRQQVSFETVDAALDGSDYGSTVTDVTDLHSALAGIILGNIGPISWQSYESGSTPAPPANNFAQTNIQWIVEFEDTVTGQIRTTRVGTADLTLATVMYNNAPALNLASTEGAAFVSAFEALVTNGGNPVEVRAVYFRE